MSAVTSYPVSGRHGTTSGYSRHQNDGEQPCPACMAAKAEYDRRWRAANCDEKTKSGRMAARAQGRAAARMRALHPEDWARLYAEAKAEIAAETSALSAAEEAQ